MELTKAALTEQYNLLKAEYINLLNDKDVLINWGKPQLEALYTTKIGVHQIERLQQQLHIKALKRKIELVQSAVNRGEDFDVNEIELTVGAELAMTEAKIMGEVAKLEQAKHMLTHLESPERSAGLRDIFRQLAKQLHPDANQGLTPEQIEIWHLVKDAYENGDLEKLKALQVVYEKEISQTQEKEKEFTEEEISLRSTVLKEGIKLLNEEIKTIKAQFPFILEDQIKDDEWVSEQVAIIQKELEQLKSYEAELSQQYAELINRYGTR